MAPTPNQSRTLRATVRTSLTVGRYLISALLFLVALAPAALWLSFAAFAVRASDILGYWPSYRRPDPKDLPDSVQWMNWVDASLVLSFLTFGACLGLLALRRFVPKRWWLPVALCICLAAWGISVALFRADPWGIVAWAFD